MGFSLLQKIPSFMSLSDLSINGLISGFSACFGIFFIRWVVSVILSALNERAVNYE